METKLEIISTAAVNFLSQKDIYDVYEQIVSDAMRLMGGISGSIILIEEKGMRRVYASNKSHFKNKVRRRANTYASYSQQKILVVPISKLASAHPELLEEKVNSAIFIPLSYQNKAEGVLVIYTQNEVELSSKDIHLLTLFGAMASLAISKTELFMDTKSALETRDHFISLASHELRTPLTSINGYIQLLHQRMKDQDTVESKWIKELSHESKRLTGLISELMEINHIKQKTLQFDLRENKLNDFYTDLAERVKKLTDREINFENRSSSKHQKFIGDSEKLINVFIGLIANAEKFSPTDKPISVVLDSTISRFCISVIDQGSGMEDSDISKVFQGFHKVDMQEGEGFGVGLLLAKHIVKFHHGTIEMISKVKKGTKVMVKLPLIH